MLYLFVGTDAISKKRKIEQLRRELIGSAVLFDFITLFGKGLTGAALQEELELLPAQAAQRLIVIKEIKRLSPDCKRVIASFLQSKKQKNVVVFDCEPDDLKDPILQKLSTAAKVIRFEQERTLTAFDLARAIERKNSKEAFRIFAQLMGKGEDIGRIMGGLVWHWKRLKRTLPLKEFRRGLEEFFTTDINIKTGRMRPELAVELLIVKLCR